MTTPLETFTTITHNDFNWPYPKPILIKPSQPPMSTGIRLYLPRVDPEDCKCDAHAYQNDKNRYKHLADKEKRIYDEMVNVNLDIKNLTLKMLENKCASIDETMKSVYTTDYEKRGLPIDNYRQLMAAIDSPYCSPIKAEVSELLDGYKDPSRFRYSAIERPHIQPPKTLTLLEVPELLSLWDQPFSCRSEYIDTTSKMGLSNIKNRQQYLEPLPSSRRRLGDCKL